MILNIEMNEKGFMLIKRKGISFAGIEKAYMMGSLLVIEHKYSNEPQYIDAQYVKDFYLEEE